MSMTTAKAAQATDAELPEPPAGEHGWPWAIDGTENRIESGIYQTREAVSPLPPGRDWPRISIVTPSYNQGHFIEETIRSVLLQGYPNLEYIIIDGGSTDDTIGLIRKYEKWISHWVTEPDRGQTHAINKGWGRATGSILGWINSDDCYYPGALWAAAAEFLRDDTLNWLSGTVVDGYSLDRTNHRHTLLPCTFLEALGRRNVGFCQPGMFWHRRMLDSLAEMDESLHFCFDSEFWIRSLKAGFVPKSSAVPMAFFRFHATSKTCSKRALFLAEDWRVYRRYKQDLTGAERSRVCEWLREREAFFLLDVVYGHLAERRRLKALVHLLGRLRLSVRLSPPKLYLGALLRCLLSGRPPRWWHA